MSGARDRDFHQVVGEVLGCSCEEDFGTIRLSDVAVDEVALFELVLLLQEINPYFRLPDQVDPLSLTIDDLLHFVRVMGAGHAEEPTT